MDVTEKEKLDGGGKKEEGKQGAAVAVFAIDSVAAGVVVDLLQSSPSFAAACLLLWRFFGVYLYPGYLANIVNDKSICCRG